MGFWVTITFSVFLLLPFELHAQEADLVDRISSLRLNIERIEDAANAVQRHRDSVSRQHEALASQIKDIKENMDNSVLPNFSLESKLRKSQELSKTLTLLNRELQALKKAKRQRLQQLDTAYTHLVDYIAKSAKTAPSDQRGQLIKLLAKARKERAAIRAQLSSDTGPVEPEKDLDEKELLASDDPEELSERADAIRDEQDKLRKELALLDKRLRQLADEARLDREMKDFVGDQDIFNENSRVLVVPNPRNQKDSSPENNEGGLDYSGNSIGNDRDGDVTSSQPSDDSIAGDGWRGIPDAGNDSQCLVPNRTQANETAVQLKKRKEWIIKRLKKLQLIHDRILEHMDLIEKE